MIFAYLDPTPATPMTSADYVQGICFLINKSIGLGTKIYPSLWALLIVRRVLTA